MTERGNFNWYSTNRLPTPGSFYTAKGWNYSNAKAVFIDANCSKWTYVNEINISICAKRLGLPTPIYLTTAKQVTMAIMNLILVTANTIMSPGQLKFARERAQFNWYLNTYCSNTPSPYGNWACIHGNTILPVSKFTDVDEILVLSHFVILAALCNKIVGLCEKLQSPFQRKKLSQSVINLVQMVGGQ